MADIILGAKQFPNPKNIKVSADTDTPKGKGTRLAGAEMNISNPPQSDIEPKKHPIDELFGRGIKRSNGRSIPKDLVESDN